MAAANWTQLRQQIRGLETQTDALFHKYSQFASVGIVTSEPSESEQQTVKDIQELLEMRETLISQISRLLDSDASLTNSAVKQNNLQRHKEILTEHRRELQSIRVSITEARNRSNLLKNVRSDVDAYRSSSASGADAGRQEADYMLDERSRIDRSHDVVDGVLSQAYAINDQFGIQRETLARINQRITSAANQIPGINSLMGRIGAKKRRDGIILGAFIAICFLLFFFLS